MFDEIKKKQFSFVDDFNEMLCLKVMNGRLDLKIKKKSIDI